jgi:hypothetical protein
MLPSAFSLFHLFYIRCECTVLALDSLFRTSWLELNRVATKAATTTMATTILTVVETVVILNIDTKRKELEL